MGACIYGDGVTHILGIGLWRSWELSYLWPWRVLALPRQLALKVPGHRVVVVQPRRHPPPSSFNKTSALPC